MKVELCNSVLYNTLLQSTAFKIVRKSLWRVTWEYTERDGGRGDISDFYSGCVQFNSGGKPTIIAEEFSWSSSVPPSSHTISH